MSSLADFYCVLTREAGSLSSPRGRRSVLSDLIGSEDGYGYHSDYGYSGDHGGGYSNDYHDCCPLVVDAKTLSVLLALGAAATYLLQ